MEMLTNNTTMDTTNTSMATVNSTIATIGPRGPCRQVNLLADCKYYVSLITGVIVTAIVLCGLFFNIMSIFGMNKMKLNREALFLCTCLAAFDTLFLLNNLCSRQIVLFGYFLGFGDLRNTRYRYADLYLMRNLFRFSGTCSCWTVVLLTLQR